MAGSLNDPRAKLARANQHLQTLEGELRAFWDLNFDCVGMHSNEDATHHIFYVRKEVRPDASWPLIAGDCLFNLRAALDQLVYQLHLEALGTLDAATERRSMFPVHRTRDDFDEAGRRRVALLPTEVQAAIERLQPYHADDMLTGQAVGMTFTGWDAGLVGRIHDLNVLDKHRRMHVVTTAVREEPRKAFPAELGFRVVNHHVPLKLNAVVTEWFFATPPPTPMKVETKITPLVQLREGDVAVHLAPHLKACALTVKAIFKNFERFFRSP